MFRVSCFEFSLPSIALAKDGDLFVFCYLSFVISHAASLAPSPQLLYTTYMSQIGYRGLYNKKAAAPYRLSRSKIELFTQCQRCFWLEAVKGIKRPSSPPFNINKAIDELFKKEFDFYREKQQPHPLMTQYGVDAVPFAHKQMDTWRHNFSGVSHLHKATNLLIFGAVDDVWVNPKGELIVVDYKATAKDAPVKELKAKGSWHDTYRRQMEIYQWLLKQNGFDVSDTGYFVYATGSWAHEKFDNILKFETHVFANSGDTAWIEQTVIDMRACLDSDEMPPVGIAIMGGACEHCEYAKARTGLTLEYIKKADNSK